jgi:hypothetical protein
LCEEEGGPFYFFKGTREHTYQPSHSLF